MRLIILAAGMGTRLRPLTDDRPKCLVQLNGRELVEWQIDAARQAGLTDIVMIGGYRIDLLRRFPVEIVENKEYATTNMVETLFRARHLFGGDFIMSYGDIAYGPGHLRTLMESKAPIGVVVDRQWRGYWEARFTDPLGDAETLRLDTQGDIIDIGRKPQSLDEIQAQYIGLVRVQGQGVTALTETYDAIRRGDRRLHVAPEKMYMTDLLRTISEAGLPLRSVPVDGGWVEIDSIDDLRLAERLVADGRLA